MTLYPIESFCIGKMRDFFQHMFSCAFFNYVFIFCYFASDGVGDGQLALCREFEVSQIKAAFRLIDVNYNPKITFIVVQKRINTRIFKVNFIC